MATMPTPCEKCGNSCRAANAPALCYRCKQPEYVRKYHASEKGLAAMRRASARYAAKKRAEKAAAEAEPRPGPRPR